jgi:hypothetical protein
MLIKIQKYFETLNLIKLWHLRLALGTFYFVFDCIKLDLFGPIVDTSYKRINGEDWGGMDLL